MIMTFVLATKFILDIRSPGGWERGGFLNIYVEFMDWSENENWSLNILQYTTFGSGGWVGYSVQERCF
jgi:hypothetical protein